MSDTESERGLGQTNHPLQHLEGKYLTFAMSQERYGLEILKVQEIIGMMHITKVPNAPKYVCGVINLRGRIIPVINLRSKLGLEPIGYDSKTCVIVVNVKVQDRVVLVGVIVDTVLEVISFAAKQLEPAPQYGTDLDTNCIIAMGRSADEQVNILIDIERALADTPLGQISQNAQKAAREAETH